MAQQDEKQKQVQGSNEQPEQEKKSAPESAVWELPNSVMAAMPTPPPPPDAPNSVMREMMDPQMLSDASGADRFSARYISGTPNSVMREMEILPDKDYSSIHSHSNSLNILQRESRNPYFLEDVAFFGKDGGSSPFPAHELSHTVRRESAPDRITLSVSSSIIQRDPEDEDEKPDPKPGSTSEKSVKSEPFKGLSVMVDEKWTDAKAAETMIRSANEEARRNSPTTSTTVHEEDPNVPPESQHGGEVLRDSITGLWVERAGQDLFVYIDGEWLAAKEQDSPPKGSGDDLSGRDLSEHKLDPTEKSLSGGNEIAEELSGGSEQQTDSSSDLPPFNEVFGSGNRWRFFSKELTQRQILGLVAYYKAYLAHHRIHIEFPTSPNIVAKPIDSALNAAKDAVEDVSGGADQVDEGSSSHLSDSSPSSRSSSPEPGADRSGLIPDLEAEQVPVVLPYGRYRDQGDRWKNQKRHLGNASIAQNIGMGASAFGRQGVLLNNYKYHVHQSAKDNLPIWDESKWKLPTSGNPVKDSNGNIVSSGEFNPYVNYVAPIAGTALGAFGVGTGIAGMVHGIHDTVRQRQNVAAGASRWDAAQSGLDAVAATSSTMSSAWGMAQSIGSIGHAATSTFGDAAHAIPGLSIVTGAANAVSGTAQAIRGRKTRSELNAAKTMLDNIASQPINPSPHGQLTDQEKLWMIMKQGQKTATFNMWSGGLKAISGGLTAASGIASLAGAAPVAAGIQGVVAVLNIARSIFEKVYKSKMRNSIVAEEFNIDWKNEMKYVYDMLKEKAPSFKVRDKDVRRVILKAHGSDAATRTAAYNTIKLNRAQYLINTATSKGNPFRKVADMVIEAMGVHKINGKDYAAGAAKLLAEKLG